MAQVTKAEFARMRGVSLATIQWMTTPPDERPPLLGYVDVAPVLVSQNAYARLWGAGVAAIHHQVRRGVIRLHGDSLIFDVHQADLAWGLLYWDRALARVLDAPEDPSPDDAAVLHTIELQAIERQLIRLGHLEPAGVVEAQLRCLARSPEWWRRPRAGKQAVDDVLCQPVDDTKPRGGRPRNAAHPATAASSPA